MCACLPDTDFIPGLLIGYISRYHQMYSHTIGFSVIVTFLVFIVLKLRKAENTGFVVLITFIALSSHLFLDLLNCDTRDPVGIMALWPFTSRHFAVYQVFYAVPHSTFEDVHSAVLLNAALREVLVVGIPLMVLVLLKYLQTNREK